MKSYLKNAIIVTVSSATLVWADIDSKSLLKLIYPSAGVSTLAESPTLPTKLQPATVSKPLMQKRKKVVVMAKVVHPTPPEPAPSVTSPVVPTFISPPSSALSNEKRDVPHRDETIIADVWIRDYYSSGGLAIPGCDDAVKSIYGATPPPKIRCQSRDEGTAYIARSTETDTFTKGYIWNYAKTLKEFSR